jgi:hypothetical protein
MAQQPLNQYKTITGIVSTSNVGIYTTKTGYTSIILYAQVANTGTGIGTVTFYHERDNRLSGGGINTTTTEIINNGLIPSNDSLILLDGKLVLERTALKVDRIRMVGISTTVPNHLKYTISILETLNQ